MIPIVVFWTEYTATVNGRVLKLVLCENCKSEYVYVLERESIGAGTSVYGVNDEGAQDQAVSSAEGTLQEYLSNDFDPVPCPVCGHYQTYMFPKLIPTRSLWSVVAAVATLVTCCMSVVTVAYRGINYVQEPNNHTMGRLGAACLVLVSTGLLALGLAAFERARGSAASTRTPRTSTHGSRRENDGPSLGRSSRRGTHGGDNSVHNRATRTKTGKRSSLPRATRFKFQLKRSRHRRTKMPTPTLRRCLLTAGIAGVVLFAGAYYMWLRNSAGDRDHAVTQKPSAEVTLDELCRDSFDEGWKVKHSPDLPGPYRQRLPGLLYYHPGGESFSTVRLCDRSGAVAWEERTRPGVEFLTLELETSDGRRSHGLLVRGE